MGLDIKAEDFLNKQILDKLWSEDNMTEYIIYEYATEYQLNYDDLEDDEEFLESKELRNFFDSEIDFRINNTIELFNNEIISGDSISIWRKMMVKDDWVDHLNTRGKRLGIYWSWDEDAAEAHWGHGAAKNLVNIESIIKIKYVNWKDTILANMHPIYIEEKEIQLYKNTPLEIVMLEWNEENITHLLKQTSFRS